MNQSERMNSASNSWEADPWDASDEIADMQFSGFQIRAAKPLSWNSIRSVESTIFGISISDLHNADVAFYTIYDGEEMLLMQSPWHGFPDPPEWRLATRPFDNVRRPWMSWGYFADFPKAWLVPNNQQP